MISRQRWVLNGAFLLLMSCGAWLGRPDTGTLELTIIDAATGKPTPARLEVLAEDGTGLIAEDALPFTDLEHNNTHLQWTLNDIDQKAPRRIVNPYTGKHQFYSRGDSVLTVPPGTYRVRAAKGIEYRMEPERVDVRRGETQSLSLVLTRWIDMPQRGWYGADDHLHISRRGPYWNSILMPWMQAEDIHVANFLHYGTYDRFDGTPQYAHGPAGVHQEGQTIIATGQENPRTHILGHVIILGARSEIHLPETYLTYRSFLEEARRQGALSGYAHGWKHKDRQGGLAIDLPTGLLDFHEVIQSRPGNDYRVWYDALNLGFRIAATAGTDYPYFALLPGRNRFYTRVEGRLTYQNWLDGIRRGRTFVTNGPMLEFTVDGKDIGGEVLMKTPGSVTLQGQASFDPKRDNVRTLEVIENGSVLRTFSRDEGSSQVTFGFDHVVKRASWFAIRISGTKIGEQRESPSLAHTGPIYVSVEGLPGLAGHPAARQSVRRWTEWLDYLEERLSEDKIEGIADLPRFDNVPVAYLRANRGELLEAIREARRSYQALLPKKQ